jgi:hypothetical protein
MVVRPASPMRGGGSGSLRPLGRRRREGHGGDGCGVGGGGGGGGGEVGVAMERGKRSGNSEGEEGCWG